MGERNIKNNQSVYFIRGTMRKLLFLKEGIKKVLYEK